MMLRTACAGVVLTLASYGQTPWPKVSTYTDPTGCCFARSKIATEGNLSAILLQWNDGLFVTTSDAAAQVWSTPFQVSDPSMNFNVVNNESDNVHVLNGTIHVGWRSSDGLGGQFINYRFSDDGGATWSPLTLIQQNELGDLHMAVSAGTSGDNVFFAWNRSTSLNGPPSAVMLSANDLGSPGSFLPPVHVAGWSPGSFEPRSIGLCPNGDEVDVVWVDDRGFNHTVWHARSTNRGQAFGTEQQLSTDQVDPTPDTDVQVRRVAGTVAVAWNSFATGQPVYTAISTDDGASFGAEQQIGQYPFSGGFAKQFDLEIDPTAPTTIVYLALWLFDELYTTTTHDAGATFAADVQHAAVLDDPLPELFVSAAGHFALLWEVGDVVESAHSDGGGSWTNVTMTTGPALTFWPTAAFNDSTCSLIAIWKELAWDTVVSGYSVCGGGGPTPYCTPKTSSAGCVTTIATSDPANHPVSGAGGYAVTASDVQEGKSGVVFAGLAGPATLPFNGGTLCVNPPTKRGPIQFSGGDNANECDGAFATTVNDGMILPIGLDAGPGNSAWYQYWYRDPNNGAGTLGTALSDAIRLDYL